MLLERAAVRCLSGFSRLVEGIESSACFHAMKQVPDGIFPLAVCSDHKRSRLRRKGSSGAMGAWRRILIDKPEVLPAS